MSILGWSKAKYLALVGAERLGHRLGQFRKNGRVGGSVVRTAICGECGCRVSVIHRGGEWVSDVGSKGKCEKRVRGHIRRRFRGVKVRTE